MWRNRAAFRPTFLELLEREDIDARVVFVDAFTSVGGSQFVDSHGSGRYHTYVCEEIVPFVDGRYDSNGFRGVAGKSSGGYGAAVTAMLRPDLFSGFASHAGGGLFEVSIRPFFRLAARRLRERLRRIHRAIPGRASHRPGSARPPARPPHPASVGLFGGLLGRPGRDDPASVRHDDGAGDPGAAGSAGSSGTIRRWCPRRADALRELRAIYVDVGTRDEWFLDLTAEWLRRELTALPVRDLHVELFDATHSRSSTGIRSASAISRTDSARR